MNLPYFTLKIKCDGATLGESDNQQYKDVASAKQGAFMVARRIMQGYLADAQPLDMTTYCEITNDVDKVVCEFTFRECAD